MEKESEYRMMERLMAEAKNIERSVAATVERNKHLASVEAERDALLAEVADRQQTEDEILVALGSTGIQWCDIAKEVTALKVMVAALAQSGREDLNYMRQERDELRDLLKVAREDPDLCPVCDGRGCPTCCPALSPTPTKETK